MIPDKSNEKYDILLIGTEANVFNYLGVRTLHLKKLIEEYLPNLKVGVYDVEIPDEDRVIPNASNHVFLPWVETIDRGWCDFFMHRHGICHKILYTDNFYWYRDQKTRMMKEGFNLENIFTHLAFSAREESSWWDNPKYAYWGLGISHGVYKDIPHVGADEKSIFVDKTFSTEVYQRSSNAVDVLDEKIPELKKRNPGLKVITQGTKTKWADEIIDDDLEYSKMLSKLNSVDAYIVSHSETCGLMQVDARMLGTRLVTTDEFSNMTIKLPGQYTQKMWSLEDPDSFVPAVEECLEDYDRERVARETQEAYDESAFIEKFSQSLFNV